MRFRDSSVPRQVISVISMQPALSILIPTQGRMPQLQQLLDSLAGLGNREDIPHEIIVANNAQDKTTATAVEALLEHYRSQEPERWVHVRDSFGDNHALSID